MHYLLQFAEENAPPTFLKLFHKIFIYLSVLNFQMHIIYEYCFPWNVHKMTQILGNFHVLLSVAIKNMISYNTKIF